MSRSILSGLLLVLAAGCVVTNGPVTPQYVVGKLPVLAILPQAPQNQVGGGALVSAAPVVYAMNQQFDDPNQLSTCRLVSMPDRLAFVVTISSGLPQILQSQGMMVQLSAGGSPIETSTPAMPQTPYQGNLAPGTGQRQIMVYGPPCASIADNTVITLTMSRVVTSVDPSGYPATAQDFYWYFNYTTQPVQQTPQSPQQVVTDQPVYDNDGHPHYHDDGSRGGDGWQHARDQSVRQAPLVATPADKPAPAKKPAPKMGPTTKPTTRPAAVMKKPQ